MKVDGYDVCACGTLVDELLFAQFGKRCLECFKKGRFARINEVLLAGGARDHLVVKAPTSKPAKKRDRKWEDRAKTPKLRESRDREARSRLAREAALRQLANLHPGEFALLLAIQRAERGLPTRYNEYDLDAAIETYLAGAAYDAAAGGRSDGLAHKESNARGQ